MLENFIDIRALYIIIRCLLVSYYFNKETTNYKFRLAHLPLETIKTL